MFNTALIRSLIIYAVCVAVALVLGCVLPTLLADTMSFYIAIFVLALLLLPLLLKWHHFWLIATWNTVAVLFFVPGRPSVVLALSFISLGISILQHILNRKMEFVRAPSIALPVLALLAVVLVTAKLTGGMGLSVLGSSEVGGKRYVVMLGGMAGYFALAAHRIPPNKAILCAAAFYLGGATWIISDLAHFFPPSAFYYILLLFPSTNWWEGDTSTQFVAGSQAIGRLGGVAAGCSAILFCLMAVYGISGIFQLRKLWRPVLFIAAIVGCLYGGYRGTFVLFALIFAGVFCFEGLPKTRFLPGMVCGILLLFVCMVPFTNKLPLPVQRSLTVVPFLNLSADARNQAEDTSEWRLRLWRTVLPEVPKYLLLGKGLSISAADLAEVTSFGGAGNGEAEGNILASDFHSGPLSVIIPFGLPGVLAFLWLIWAGYRALYNNYLYGDPELRHVNTFLLAAFVARTVFFIFVFGSLFGDLVQFTGVLGISMALNGGIRKPVLARASEVQRASFGRSASPFHA